MVQKVKDMKHINITKTKTTGFGAKVKENDAAVCVDRQTIENVHSFYVSQQCVHMR